MCFFYDLRDRPCEFFYLYNFCVIEPMLCPGQVVIMDNLAAHKVAGVHQLIESTGTRLLYQPPCSPDFNPIEQAGPRSNRCCARPRPEA